MEGLDDLFDRQCNYLYSESDDDDDSDGPVYPKLPRTDYPIFYSGDHKYSLLFGMGHFRGYFGFSDLVFQNRTFFKKNVLIPVNCDSFEVYFHHHHSREPRTMNQWQQWLHRLDREYALAEDRWTHSQIIEKGASACILT